MVGLLVLITDIEDFFARHGKPRDDNLMVPDLMLVQVKSLGESKCPRNSYKGLATISGEEAFGPPNAASSLVLRNYVVTGHATEVANRRQ